MAEKEDQQQQEQEHQEPVLLLGLTKLGLALRYPKVLTKFKLLFPTSPLHQFLKTHAQSIRVLFCSSGNIRVPINSDLLDCVPCLKCIVVAGVGLDHIDVSECKRRGVSVANAGNVFTEDVADCAVALLLDVLRKVSASDRYVRSGAWPLMGDFPLGHKVGRKRVGIVGLGSIGSEVAKRLESFGCSISYNSRKKKEAVSFPYYSNVTDLAVNSDILILCCALTEETYHFVNKDVLSALGKEGIVINVGRGALIDEKELVHSLVKGEIGGAGLEVFENEPDVPKELFGLDNVVLSPHCAVRTPESYLALQDLLIANLEAAFSNRPLLSLVNYE